MPIIGCGGITSGSDALEFLMAGASAVQVGTANFTNPNAALEVLDQFESILKSRRITRLADIIGIAHE